MGISFALLAAAALRLSIDSAFTRCCSFAEKSCSAVLAWSSGESFWSSSAASSRLISGMLRLFQLTFTHALQVYR